MKKTLLYFACFLFLLTGCAHKTGQETSPYFFPDHNRQYSYSVRYEATDTEHFEEKQVQLDIHLIREYSNGVLYELSVDDVSDAATSIPLLGYFYVTPDRIIQIDTDADKEAVSAFSEDELVAVGKVVAQDSPVEDALPQEEKGMHSFIALDENRCTSTTYNNAVETGFHQTYVWEKDVGLVEYRSGFGAEKHLFEILIVSGD